MNEDHPPDSAEFWGNELCEHLRTFEPQNLREALLLGLSAVFNLRTTLEETNDAENCQLFDSAICALNRACFFGTSESRIEIDAANRLHHEVVIIKGRAARSYYEMAAQIIKACREFLLVLANRISNTRHDNAPLDATMFSDFGKVTKVLSGMGEFDFATFEIITIGINIERNGIECELVVPDHDPMPELIRELKLSVKEARLLQVLLTANKPISFDDLKIEVHENEDCGDAAVERLIKRTNKKLITKPFSIAYLTRVAFIVSGRE